MGVEEIKQKVEEILRCKKIKKSQYKAAFKMLDTIKDDVSVRYCYDNYMGRLLFRQGNLECSKYYFLDQLSIGNNCYSAYYDLYKISIYQGNYNEALMNLEMYMECSDSYNHNVKLSYAMLKMYIDLVNDGVAAIKNVETIDYVDCNQNDVIIDGEVLELYNQLIGAFNDKNMKVINNHLTRLDAVIRRKKLSIDISPLKVVAKALNNKLKKVCIQSIKEDPDMLKTRTIDHNIADICIYNNYVNANKALNMIDKLVDKDPVVAEILLDKMSKHYRSVNEDSVEVSYLRNKINERKKYTNLSESSKNIYNICIIEGRKEFDRKEYYNSLIYYQVAAIVTEHPIFNYYIGEVLYKVGKLDEAYKYMMDYEACGGEKELPSLLYLNAIDERKKRHKLVNKRENKRNKLVNYFQGNRNWRSARKKMNLNIEGTELAEVEFNDIDFDDKLSIIQSLYQGKQVDMDSLLISKIESFNDSSNEEQKEKIYINKRKTSNNN